MKKRFWEIDFFRGIAIILMIIFHILWNLDHFNYINLDDFNAELNLFQILIASMFLLIVGVALTINKRKKYSKIILQGMKIIGYGMIVSIVTFFVFEDFFVRFGILHLIGLGVIIVYPFTKLNKYYSLFFGVSTIIIGNLITRIEFTNNYFLFLGLKKASMLSVDYYPLLPWLGVIFIGVFLGKLAYKNYKRNFKIWECEGNTGFLLVGFLGRHSLVIYLLHQVVLFGGFWVFS
jgi:uncharacterized membrane protein